MRSAASGIWNHSFSPAVNELAPFGAVCASAADTSVAATIRAALRATIDFLNIVVTPAWGSHLVVCDCMLLEWVRGVYQPDVPPNRARKRSRKAKKAAWLKDYWQVRVTPRQMMLWYRDFAAFN